MKFQQLIAFEKHLEKAAPHHLSRVYFVAAAHAFERRKIYEGICAALQKKESKLSIVNFSAEQADWGRVSEELNTASFLGGCRVVIVDEIDKFKKGAFSSLLNTISKPSPFAYLILGAASSKNLSEIYEVGKKELIACDLSAEKPWERKDRLKTTLLKWVAQEEKAITPEALVSLMERAGGDLAVLEQELNKLICYLGDRKQITLQDVQAIGLAEKSLNLWQAAEAIVWGKVQDFLDPTFELASFIVLLGQVRSHVQHGLQLAVCLEQGKPLPTLPFKPLLLERAIPIAKQRTSRFFTAGLSLLFEMELLAKNSPPSPQILLSLLIAKMDRLRALSPS